MSNHQNLYSLTRWRGWRPPRPSPIGAVVTGASVVPPPEAPPWPTSWVSCGTDGATDPGLSLSPLTTSVNMLVTPVSVAAGSPEPPLGNSLLVCASSVGLTAASACLTSVFVVGCLCGSVLDWLHNHLTINGESKPLGWCYKPLELECSYRNIHLWILFQLPRQTDSF